MFLNGDIGSERIEEPVFDIVLFIVASDGILEFLVQDDDCIVTCIFPDPRCYVE